MYWADIDKIHPYEFEWLGDILDNIVNEFKETGSAELVKTIQKIFDIVISSIETKQTEDHIKQMVLQINKDLGI